jgi:hypothetical protein
MREFQVYALLDPDSLIPRYVGISVHPLIRLSQHIRTAMSGDRTRKSRSIRKLLDSGRKPIVRVAQVGLNNPKSE